MSNINHQLYLAGMHTFAKTLVLKDSYLAEADNQYVIMKGQTVNVGDPRTWKYYLNMSGQYHSIDTPMTIKSLDTLEEISFDKVTLLRHRATIREYSYGSDYYNALVERYPEQEFLIRRILNPVDIDLAIKAKDYQILYYDISTVEPQESNLIPELQGWIDNLVRRWYIPMFKRTDELYPIAFHAQLINFVPAKIENIRLHNCKTYKAHSYHIWEYLESNGHLSAYKPLLSLEQSLWLYRNIRWVYHGVGRRDTFQALMEVILTKRGIPLGSYDVVHDVEQIPNKMVPVAMMRRTALNLLETINEPQTIESIEYVLARESPLALNNADIFVDSLPVVKSFFATTAQNTLPTKVYESSMVDLSGSEPFTMEDVLLNNWISMAATNRYAAAITVPNPYTGDIMTMTMREAFLTYLYTYNRVYGNILTEIPVIQANMSYRLPVPTFEELRSVSTERWVSDAMINQWLDEAPVVGAPISTESFYLTCNRIHKNALLRRKQYMQQGNKNTHRQLKSLFWNFYETKDYMLNSTEGEVYLEYFNNRGWVIDELNQSDAAILATDILNKATGSDTQNLLSLKDIQGAMLRLMKQLGTYSTQYIQTINESAVIPVGPYVERIGEIRKSSAFTINADGMRIDLLDYDVFRSKSFKYDLDILAVQVLKRDKVKTVETDTSVGIQVKRGFTRTIKLRAPIAKMRVDLEPNIV